MDRTKNLILEAQNGSENAKETLVLENSRLVWSVVRRFMGRGTEAEDLYQIGIIGLLKCIEKFDFSFDVKFSTYAVPMIIGEIRRFLRDDGAIKVSRSLKELAYKAKKMEESLKQDGQEEISIIKLANALEVSVEELNLALEAQKDIESLNAPIIQDETLELQDRISKTEDNEFLVDKICLMNSLKTLNPKEKQIIVLRYFEDKTQSEVAKKIGISQVQVSRIEKKILERMRKKLSGDF